MSPHADRQRLLSMRGRALLPRGILFQSPKGKVVMRRLIVTLPHAECFTSSTSNHGIMLLCLSHHLYKLSESCLIILYYEEILP